MSNPLQRQSLRRLHPPAKLAVLEINKVSITIFICCTKRIYNSRLIAAGRAIRLALMRSSYRVGCFNLWKLESHSRPGLTASEFYKLFTQCRCGMIMTRRVFWRHRCQFTVIELNSEGDVMVDLTLTDSDSTTSLID